MFETNIFDVANNSDKSPCYLCARMRRGPPIQEGARNLAVIKSLGHHFNDVIETTVMSMFYGSRLQAMPPKLHSTNFPGMTLIRPMYCIRAEDIIAWRRYNELEFIQCACRFTEACTICDNGGGGSKRQEVKILLRRLMRDNPNIENSIFRSIHAVSLDTMPGYKTEGEEHSFLERFDRIEEALKQKGFSFGRSRPRSGLTRGGFIAITHLRGGYGRLFHHPALRATFPGEGFLLSYHCRRYSPVLSPPPS